MKKPSGLKILGYIATIGGIVLTLTNDYLSDKRLDEKIDEKLALALAKKDKD